MGSYVPSTQQERRRMLDTIGVSTIDDLYCQVPKEVKLQNLNLPQGKSELEVRSCMEALAQKNIQFTSIFRGAGAYHHYIPAIVKSVTSKEEFVTAYTPYQAEISQGVLQSIFEFQTMITQLTGLDAANASIYDGASAAAEAAAMCRDRKRQKVLVSEAVNPGVLSTIRTYCEGANTPLEVVPVNDGVTDKQALSHMLDETVSCFYMEYPNFYGQIEDATDLGELVHQAGAKFIMGCHPIAISLLKCPGECGADIAVGEGQPLGMPLAFGGPYLGFMTCTQAMVRKLPGRIVGETVDLQGKRAYVLTLQAREQHIRREKASSNVCSNQALCAMTASVYMAAMGSAGMRQTAKLCMSKASYAAGELCSIPGISQKFKGPYFNEFVTRCPSSQNILCALEEKGILGGLSLDEESILWCVTEMNSKKQIDQMVEIVREAVK